VAQDRFRRRRRGGRQQARARARTRRPGDRRRRAAAAGAGRRAGWKANPGKLRRTQPMLAIIGGTGLARLAGLRDARREVVRTPYGDPSCALTFGYIDGTPIVFLARHGYGHTIA